MANRTRYRQRQSARIYFEERDHRDIIVNDNYHGAVYIGEQIEPAWRRYKPRLIPFGMDAFEELYHDIMYSFDVTNKFFSLLQEDWGDDYIEPVSTSNDWGCYYVGNIANTGCITKNGHDYKSINSSGSYMSPTQKYGSDRTVSVSANISTRVVTLNWAYLDYSQGNKFANIVDDATTRTFDIDTDHLNANSWCGRSTNGCFFYYTTSSQTSTTTTINEWLSLSENKSASLQLIWQNTTTYDRYGTYTRPINSMRIWKCGTHYVAQRRWTDNNGFITLAVMVSSDSDLTTWTTTQLVLQGGSYLGISQVLYRNGTVYAYGTTANGVWTLWTSSDFTTWTQVTLPDYVDIPYCNDADINTGRHGAVVTPTYQGIRLVLNRNATLPVLPNNYFSQNFTQFPPRYGEENYFEVINGTITGDLNSEDLVFADWFGEKTLIYIDNMTFQTSNGNMAYQLGTYWDGADPIASGDYVFGGNS